MRDSPSSVPFTWSKPSRWTAFTIVELLVGIVIVLSLVTLLLTVAENARSAAASARCMNNLRQIGVVQISYSSDNDNWITPNQLDTEGGPYFWCQLLLPYIDQPLVNWRHKPEVTLFWCPLATKSKVDDPKNGYVSYGISRLSYAQNQQAGGFNNRFSSTYPMHRRTEVQKPSKMVLVVEGKDLNADQYTADNLTSPYSASYRHNGYVNLLFLDGHVESSRHPLTSGAGNKRYNWRIGDEKN